MFARYSEICEKLQIFPVSHVYGASIMGNQNWKFTRIFGVSQKNGVPNQLHSVVFVMISLAILYNTEYR